MRVWMLALMLAMSSVGRAEEPVSLTRHVSPVLFQLGCSAGTCHGSFSGKGGFRLALFAGNADLDHRNLRGGFGRRIDPLDPEQSLLLRKPTGQMSHEGGVRLAKNSWQYRLLLNWIRAGAPRDIDGLTVVSVAVEPATLVLSETPSVTLKAIATFSDGRSEDVTKFAKFESLDPGLASIDGDNRAIGHRSGSVALLAHYAGEVGFATALIPAAATKTVAVKEVPADVVDRLLLERMTKLNIVPSPVCDDVDFLRRVYLDVVGQLPTPDEIRTFLADADPQKRVKTIDRLLRDPLHAALWAGKMCDMVGADDRFIANRVYDFHDWFRNKFEANVPWDEIARGVVVATTADGRSPEQIIADQKNEQDEKKKMKEQGKDYKPTIPEGKKPWQVGYATRGSLDLFYNNLLNLQNSEKGRVVDGKKIGLRVAHAFLGVQLECAQCHKHPYDRWSQADFFRFSAAFAHVGIGGDPRLKAKKVNLSGVWPSDKASEEFLDPETREPLSPRIPGGADLTPGPDNDVREDIWKWMTAKENPFFASALVNRVWDHYLGRGFVTPVDGQAAANPPSHPEVLKELCDDFIAHKFDIRHLERRVLMTLAYQRDWRTNDSNAKDERNFSRRILRRMTAEQALDAIAQVTGIPVKTTKRFSEIREGIKAVEIAVSRVGGDDGYVLTIFGRPLRVQNSDCERSPAVSLSQTLYLFNDEKLIAKIHDPKGRVAELVAKQADDAKLIEELFLWTLSRRPTSAETDRMIEYVRSIDNRMEAYQDAAWSLMNRPEFIVNR